MSEPYLRMVNIQKSFPGVQALKGVDFEAYAGEALALIGANGAGKSTLMNVLGGVIQPDEGEIRIAGNTIKIHDPLEATDHGIAFVHQEMAVLRTLTIAENLYITSFPTRNGLIDYEKAPPTQPRCNAEVYNPDISNPDISNPDISNPDISNPDISNPDISNLVIANPDISNPDISNPDISNPDTSNPDISNPDISNPDISNGSLTDGPWTIRNDGNTTASFNVTLFLANQAAAAGGVKTQLVVHKTYKTPVSDGCVLKSQTQTVLVAKVDDPVFLNTTDDPTFDPANPDISNTTLWLEPGGEGKITLRIVDPDPTDTVEIRGLEKAWASTCSNSPPDNPILSDTGSTASRASSFV